MGTVNTLATAAQLVKDVNPNRLKANAFAQKAWPGPGVGTKKIAGATAGLDHTPSKFVGPSIAETAAGYMSQHGSNFESHMRPKERIEWTGYQRGADLKLMKQILQDPGKLPEQFDLKRHVPLYAGTVGSQALPTVVGRLRELKLGSHSGHKGKNGLEQLAEKISVGKDGPQADAAGYKKIGAHGTDSLWLLEVSGDHHLASEPHIGSEAPSVPYGFAITGHAFQELFNQHLRPLSGQFVMPSIPNGGID